MGETHHKKGPSLNFVAFPLLLQQSVIIYELTRPVVGLLEKERKLCCCMCGLASNLNIIMLKYEKPSLKNIIWTRHMLLLNLCIVPLSIDGAIEDAQATNSITTNVSPTIKDETFLSKPSPL